MARRLGALVAAVLLVAIAGCAGEAEPPEDRLAQAVATTRGARTATVWLQTQMDIGGDTGSRMSTTIEGDGAVDFDADQARLVFDMPFMAGEDATQEIVIDGDVVYSDAAGMAFGLGEDDDGPRWIRFDDDAGEGAFGGMFGEPGAGGDLTAVLDALGAVEGSVEEIGTEVIRDVPTRHYRFAISAEALADSLGMSPDDLAEGVGPQPMEAWLDDDGFVRRTVQAFDLDIIRPDFGELTDEDDSADLEGVWPSGTITSTLEWFDFGEPVDIPIPDEADVRTFDEWMEEFEGWGLEEELEMLEAEGLLGPDASDEDYREHFGDDLTDADIEALRAGEVPPGWEDGIHSYAGS